MRPQITFDWDEETVEHLAKHGVDVEEAQEACRVQPLLLRSRQAFYYVFGQTAAGRYLFVVLLRRGQRYRLITARDMDERERRRYLRR